MKDYNKRKIEECEKFCEDNDVEFEKAMDLILWVEWASYQETKNKIIKTIKESL